MNNIIRSLLSDWPPKFTVKPTHIAQVTISSFCGERFLICDHSRPSGQLVVASSVTRDEAATILEQLTAKQDHVLCVT